jgi:ribonuclease HII
MLRCYPDLSFEIPLWESDVTLVAGLDEAGRGPWAGPVTAGAVILPFDPSLSTRLSGVRDSKQMTASQRTFWVEHIHQEAVAWAVAEASHLEIDEMGILPATRLAMQRALCQLSVSPAHLLLDAMFLPEEFLPQTKLIKGDARSLSIAAASVLAKTARDQHMLSMEEQFPGYGFAQHKGYGTRFHQEALRRLGPCPIHRRSFAPIRKYFSYDRILSYKI